MIVCRYPLCCYRFVINHPNHIAYDIASNKVRLHTTYQAVRDCMRNHIKTFLPIVYVTLRSKITSCAIRAYKLSCIATKALVHIGLQSTCTNRYALPSDTYLQISYDDGLFCHGNLLVRFTPTTSAYYRFA